MKKVRNLFLYLLCFQLNCSFRVSDFRITLQNFAALNRGIFLINKMDPTQVKVTYQCNFLPLTFAWKIPSATIRWLR